MSCLSDDDNARAVDDAGGDDGVQKVEVDEGPQDHAGAVHNTADDDEAQKVKFEEHPDDMPPQFGMDDYDYDADDMPPQLGMDDDDDFSSPATNWYDDAMANQRSEDVEPLKDHYVGAGMREQQEWLFSMACDSGSSQRSGKFESVKDKNFNAASFSNGLGDIEVVDFTIDEDMLKLSALPPHHEENIKKRKHDSLEPDPSLVNIDDNAISTTESSSTFQFAEDSGILEGYTSPLYNGGHPKRPFVTNGIDIRHLFFFISRSLTDYDIAILLNDLRPGTFECKLKRKELRTWASRKQGEIMKIARKIALSIKSPIKKQLAPKTSPFSLPEAKILSVIETHYHTSPCTISTTLLAPLTPTINIAGIFHPPANLSLRDTQDLNILKTYIFNMYRSTVYDALMLRLKTGDRKEMKSEAFGNFRTLHRVAGCVLPSVRRVVVGGSGEEREGKRVRRE